VQARAAGSADNATTAAAAAATETNMRVTDLDRRAGAIGALFDVDGIERSL
jgi:hypothetical protein